MRKKCSKFAEEEHGGAWAYKATGVKKIVLRTPLKDSANLGPSLRLSAENMMELINCRTTMQNRFVILGRNV